MNPQSCILFNQLDNNHFLTLIPPFVRLHKGHSLHSGKERYQFLCRMKLHCLINPHIDIPSMFLRFIGDDLLPLEETKVTAYCHQCREEGRAREIKGCFKSSLWEELAWAVKIDRRQVRWMERQYYEFVV